MAGKPEDLRIRTTPEKLAKALFPRQPRPLPKR